MAYEIIRIATPAELKEAFSVRRNVFIEEQAVPEHLELDEYDTQPDTIHLLARDAHRDPVGTARLRPYRADASRGSTTPTAKMERVAVLASHRKSGLGRMLMDALEAEARKAGFTRAQLNAQTHAEPFYERIGYVSIGETFMEAGIEHIAMEKPL